MELSVRRIDFSQSNSGLTAVTTVYLKKRIVMSQGKSFMMREALNQTGHADVIIPEVLLL